MYPHRGTTFTGNAFGMTSIAVEHQRPHLDALARGRIGRCRGIAEGAMRSETGAAVGF